MRPSLDDLLALGRANKTATDPVVADWITEVDEPQVDRTENVVTQPNAAGIMPTPIPLDEWEAS